MERSQTKKDDNKAARAGDTAAARHELSRPLHGFQPGLGNQAVLRLLRTAVLQAKHDIERSDTEQEAASAAVAQTKVKEEKKLFRTVAPENISEIAAGTEADINALRGGGQQLPDTVRAYMEPRFGADFSRVKVHSDSNAAHSARSVNAHAFTIGNDIVFGAGRYSPETDGGKRLLAHELTHVVQQTAQFSTDRTAAPTIARNPAKAAPRQPNRDEIVAELNKLTSESYASYDDFYTKLGATTFLGLSVNNAHEELKQKLKAAEKRLTNAGKSMKASDWGIRGLGGGRPGGGRHGWGIAMDIDSGRNPYLLNESGEGELDKQLAPVYERISQFILGRESDIPKLKAGGRKMFKDMAPAANAVETAYDRLAEESEAMKTYFALMKDQAVLTAYLQKEWTAKHPGASAPDPAAQREQMMKDYLIVGGSSSSPVPGLTSVDKPKEVKRTNGSQADRPFKNGNDPAQGFLTIPKDVVLALTDSGLIWGAIDIPGEPGDVMHFDARPGPFQAKIDKATKEAQKKINEQAAAAPAQPKLESGASGDAYEQEADRMAEYMVNGGTGTGRSDARSMTAAPDRAIRIPGIQLKPAAPPALTQDQSKLKITTTIGSLDYFEFIRKNSSITVDYFSDTWNLSSKWSLYDPGGNLVDANTEAGGGKYDLTAATMRNHVDPAGPSAFGTWTLRYVKGNYFDDLDFQVAQTGGPGPALADAETTPSLFNIRELPGEKGKILGTLSGVRTPVSVSDKAMIDGRLWYKISLKAAIGKLPAGTEGWIVDDGVAAVAPWNLFLGQVRAFETANSSLGLDQRITKLRQLSHKKDLPFDSVIGVNAGTEYLDTRSFNRSEWQILEGSLQMVRVPDGSSVDMFHLMVGLDVLPVSRRVENQTYMNFNVGPNYSAATWSGDVGAGAADAFLGTDQDWEKKSGIPLPGDAGRTGKLAELEERYYTTRAPESDLLGDIDAWGVDELRSDPALNTIESLLSAYYGGTSTGPASTPVITRRKSAIERFLRQYGFKTSSALNAQAAPRTEIARQIGLFAAMWIRKRASVAKIAAYSTTDLTTWYVNPMSERFVNWLDALAKTNGATV